MAGAHGSALTYAVEHFTPYEAAELFGIIVKIKRAHEREESFRNALPLAAL